MFFTVPKVLPKSVWDWHFLRGFGWQESNPQGEPVSLSESVRSVFQTPPMGRLLVNIEISLGFDNLIMMRISCQNHRLSVSSSCQVCAWKNASPWESCCWRHIPLSANFCETCQDWETDLFGGAYDDAKPFERCKYGALGASVFGQLQ